MTRVMTSDRPLTRHERTDTLARLARATSPCERQTLIEQAVHEHLGLADALARQYANRGLELDDLVQVARLGLLLAVERYRPDTGAAFEAFAVPTIKGEIKRHFRDHGWAVRPPRRIQEMRARMRVARRDLEQDVGATPTTGQLADAMAVEPRELEECAAADSSFSPLSLDAAPAGQDSPLCERLGDESAELEVIPDLLALRREMLRLTPRERRVLTWRFVDELTQSEIGERLGVSQMQVSRILSATLAKLRSALDPVEVAAAA